MTSRIIFRLNIWQADKCCVFQLRCGEGQELSDTLEYPEELTVQYEAWRKIYLGLYLGLYKRLRGRKLSGGDLDPSSLVDYGHELEEARAKFIDTFQRWLAQLREIREKIQNKIHTVAQNLSQSGEKEVTRPTVDIFIACNSIDLGRLPWETWELVPEDLPSEILPTDILRIARIPIATRQEYVESHSHLRSGKPRILVVLGDNTGLDLDEDKQTVKALKRVAQFKFFDWQQQDGVENLKAALANEIADERGWDALFFMGHSNETEVTDGELAIAPNTYVSIDQIKDYLSTAKENGLRFCLFNSCEGLQIANRLANLGLQVAVMREPIYDDVAHVFLRQFCQELARHEDVHNAMLTACWHLQHVERFVYPSAYLIPSFFSPYGAEPFRFERWGWRKIIRQWMPTRGEAVTLGVVIPLSLIFAVHDLLSDFRYSAQAVYRDVTNQRGELPDGVLPPVNLVNIDEESVHWGIETITDFKPKPMDRQLLAQLVTRLSELEVKVIGINYILYKQTQADKTQKLADSIQSAVNEQGIWFVFNKGQFPVFSKIASPNWSLQGKESFLPWDLEQPSDTTCTDPCPFAYLLALSHILSQESSLANEPQSNLQNQSKTNFQEELSDYLKTENASSELGNFLKQAKSPFWLRPIIDFSIPNENVYNTQSVYKPISAKDLLERDSSDLELQKLKGGITIITSGDYKEAGDQADDYYSLPLAFKYWCFSHSLKTQQLNKCPQNITGGEIIAYMINHHLNLLSQNHKNVIPAPYLIPGFMIIAIAAFLGKGATLRLAKLQRKQHKGLIFALVGSTALYGIVVFQIYISVSLSIPLFLPLLTFWIYILSFLKRKYSA
ncbi:MAG: CHASE2 domain-containing protein [Symploca sp. SIO3C6]|nr:CHASE2 domain-containing protein [Symploca sp. SIO3C6]